MDSQKTQLLELISLQKFKYIAKRGYNPDTLYVSDKQHKILSSGTSEDMVILGMQLWSNSFLDDGDAVMCHSKDLDTTINYQI